MENPTNTVVPGRRIIKSLGLASDVRPVNVFSYLLSSFVSISSLVFLSAATSFVLTAVVRVPTDSLGRINGSLVLLDEIVALPMVLIWGQVADAYGYRLVTFLGHFIVAVSLSLFVQAKDRYMLYLFRIFISLGFSALTTMISAILASMTTARLESVKDQESCNEEQVTEDETTPMLPETKKCNLKYGQRSARLSGIIGFVSGLGALFAVFVLLRLPPYFANLTNYPPREALRIGVQQAFYLAALIALLIAVSMIFGLRRDGERLWPLSSGGAGRLTCWTDNLKELLLGFKLGRGHRHLGVAYAAGFSARATTIAVSAYFPVYVNQYYISSGKCQLDSPDSPKEDIKKGCHAAFALASAVTGTVELSALIFAPAFGWIAASYSQPAILAASNALGAIGFFAIGFLPTPNHYLIWPTAIILGIAQISGVVVSLSLCASCRWRIHHSKVGNPVESTCPMISSSCMGDNRSRFTARDISGAIAGVYSLCGGLGILIGSFGGMLADWAPSAPFYLSGVLTMIVGLVCCIIFIGDQKQ
ncbi:major facilitator superfamily domain-containing protein [Phakopsora pachyrhizi]|uniref:Major facilitator superfamily domain-containing protein n=1 Tax=Phakopsora pachyrhizi TaxID=170000 RepID=A0AAV0BA46_PHAPC|nr:major facilitator superfamily domain-containing protein [Phakopsora pachyrhizi]KAI8458296.1 major facilitator superfamily domain-containing protein [Phakopsora pachyrhizi]CAH7683898.1 major facilitator superfamily domain-containing protein [Phakopsora pachyrhizi]